MPRATRIRVLLGTLLLSLLGLTAAPAARACACGGFAAGDGEQVAASAEYAALTFDGKQERVLLSMNTLTSARDAALLIPPRNARPPRWPSRSCSASWPR